jgi:catechol 2,3-dioxygenase-like lactoylglutathione lyase family enzyme
MPDTQPDKRISSRDVLIQTEDLDAARAFYEHHLGLAVFMNEETIVGLEAGAFRLFLDRGPKYGPVFEFFVDDLATAKVELQSAGCVIEAEDPMVPKCYVRDPFGLTFNIAER